MKYSQYTQPAGTPVTEFSIQSLARHQVIAAEISGSDGRLGIAQERLVGNQRYSLTHLLPLYQNSPEV
ncbi:hypothetical protein JY531_03030 [Serratia marcescens]|uniref:hypothetical protein n=1 Tax=Serratia marcescens TaxID=615 RepID=UPI0018D80FCE|nr:hypothetical protein [Serratia marcescens]MBN5366507.1 hypothetical protein [Serratia marcescens]